jgi:hypothetical protein
MAFDISKAGVGSWDRVFERISANKEFLKIVFLVFFLIKFEAL